MTDNRYGTQNPKNPFGNYTLNAGPGNNFQLNNQTYAQSLGQFAEGGEYELSEEEIARLRAQGYQLEALAEPAPQKKKLKRLAQGGEPPEDPAAEPPAKIFPDPVKDWYFNGPERGHCVGLNCGEIATNLVGAATGKNKWDVLPIQDSWFLRSAMLRENGQAIYDPLGAKKAGSKTLGPVPEEVWKQVQNFDMVTMERGRDHSDERSRLEGYGPADNDDADHTGTIVRLPDNTYGIYHGYQGRYQVSPLNPDGSVVLSEGVGSPLTYKVKGIYRGAKFADPEFRASLAGQLETPLPEEAFQVTDENRFDMRNLKKLRKNEKRYFSQFDDQTVSTLAKALNVPVEDVNTAILHGASIINNESAFSGENSPHPFNWGMNTVRMGKQASATALHATGWKKDSASRGPAQMKVKDLQTNHRFRDALLKADVNPKKINSRFSDKDEFDQNNSRAVVVNYLLNRKKLASQTQHPLDPATGMLDGWVPFDYAAMGTHLNPTTKLNETKNKVGTPLWDVYTAGDRDYVNNQINYLESRGVNVDHLRHFQHAGRNQVTIKASEAPVYAEGGEYELSDEQLARLRAQGYHFEEL
jgi:hypothetical protein